MSDFKAKMHQIRCRLGRGHIVAASRLQLVFFLLQLMAANRHIIDGSDTCLDNPGLSSQVLMSLHVQGGICREERGTCPGHWISGKDEN